MPQRAQIEPRGAGRQEADGRSVSPALDFAGIEPIYPRRRPRRRHPGSPVPPDLDGSKAIGPVRPGVVGGIIPNNTNPCLESKSVQPRAEAKACSLASASR